MRTFVTTLSALTLTLVLGATAAAQDGDHDRAPETSFTFEDEGVLGGRNTPEGVIVDVRGRRMRETLVRPRVHFVPELLKSVERI